MYWMIIVGLLIIAFIIFIAVITSNINQYAKQASQNDLAEIGLSAKSFIGLHIKTMPLDHLNPKLIYVRKTTPYKGLILFIPDWKYDYHFYLPFFYALCRKGYIILTYTSEKEIYSQTPEEIKEIVDFIKNDEVLKTYPLSVLGHGSGGYASLYGQEQFADQVKIITLAPLPPEFDALLKHVQKNIPFSINRFKKLILLMSKHRYHCLLDRSLPSFHHQILLVLGQNDPLSQSFYTSIENELVTVQTLERKVHHPYLNLKSDLRLWRIIERLDSPEISQFDYDKMLETFDTHMLYDLDLDLIEKIDQFISS